MQSKKLFKNNLRFFFKNKSENLLIIETSRLKKLLFNSFEISKISFN